MYPVEECTSRPGISAVLATDERQTDLDGTVLDLAAVLDGLVYENFEIIVVEFGSGVAASDVVGSLHLRSPGLPLRLLEQRPADRAAALAAGFNAAQYELIFTAAADGQFNVRELNHLFDAIDQGADLAIGYRPHRTGGVVRRVQGWGWNVLVNLALGNTARDVDCAFKLFRRRVWQQVGLQPHYSGRTFCAELVARARRLGFGVTELPVSHYRPHVAGDVASGPVSPVEMGQALAGLNELRRELRAGRGDASASLPVTAPASHRAA